jgi:hypothetical protein
MGSYGSKRRGRERGRLEGDFCIKREVDVAGGSSETESASGSCGNAYQGDRDEKVSEELRGEVLEHGSSQGDGPAEDDRFPVPSHPPRGAPPDIIQAGLSRANESFTHVPGVAMV